MSKKKKYIYAIVSIDDKRIVPKKIFGAFDFDEKGLELAEQYLKKKNNTNLVIKKI